LALEARPGQGQDRKEPGQGEEDQPASASWALEALNEVGGKHRVKELVPAPLLSLLPQQKGPKPR
jgi:hypothetical protein